MAEPIQYFDNDSPLAQATDSKDRGYIGPGWYFWDETGSQVYGPYSDKQEAVVRLGDYAANL